MDRSAGMGLMMSDVRLTGWDGLPEHYREEPGRTGTSKIGAAARTKGPLFSGCRQPARLLNRCAPRRRQWNNPFIMSYYLLLGRRTLPVVLPLSVVRRRADSECEWMIPSA